MQRATTITYDNTQTKDSLGNGFNKATFVMNNDNTNDVDVDDADFWQKVLPEVSSFNWLFSTYFSYINTFASTNL